MIKENSSGNDQKDDKQPPSVISEPKAPNIATTPSLVPAKESASAPEQVNRTVIAEKAKEKPKETNCEPAPAATEDKLSPFEKRMFWLTLVGIAVGAITVVFFYAQLQEMRTQTGLLIGQSQSGNVDASLHAAVTGKELKLVQEQAQAAQDNVSAIREQMRQDQRAWVGTGDTTFVVNGTSPFKVQTTIKNVGKTPALEAISKIYWVIKSRDTPLVLKDIIYGQWAKTMNNGTIFPTQSLQIRSRASEIVPNQLSIANALAESSTLYIYGFIRYKDVFGRTHWTHFCYATANDMQSVAPCDIYNDTDRDPDQNQNKARR